MKAVGKGINGPFLLGTGLWVIFSVLSAPRATCQLSQERMKIKDAAQQLIKKYESIENVPQKEMKGILIRWIAYNYLVPYSTSEEGMEEALTFHHRLISETADSLVNEGILERVYNGKFCFYRIVDLEKAVKLDYVHFTFEEMRGLLISNLPFFANFDRFVPSERTIRSFPKLPGYPPGFEATTEAFMYPQEIQWLVLQYLREGKTKALEEKIAQLSKKNADTGLPPITMKDITSYASILKGWENDITMSGGLVLEYLPIFGFTLPPTSFEKQYSGFAVGVTDKWKERGEFPINVNVTGLPHLPTATHGSLIARDILIHSSADTLSTENAYHIAKRLAQNQLKVYIRWFQEILSEPQKKEQSEEEIIKEGVYVHLTIFRYATMYALFLGGDIKTVKKALKVIDLIEKKYF